MRILYVVIQKLQYIKQIKKKSNLWNEKKGNKRGGLIINDTLLCKGYATGGVESIFLPSNGHIIVTEESDAITGIQKS